LTKLQPAIQSILFWSTP